MPALSTLDDSRARYRWVVLTVATFAQAAACFFVQGLGAIGGYLQRDLDLSTFQIGLLLSAAQLVPLLGLVLAGELLDRFGERAVVAAGTGLVAVALMAGAFADEYALLLVALLVVGAGYSTAQPGGSKSVAEWFPARRRGLAMGIRQAGLPLGGALAAASLPFVAETWGWRATLVAGGLAAAAGAAAFATFYRRPRHATTAASGRAPAAGRRRELLRVPGMRRIVASGTVLITVQYGVSLLTALHLHQTAGLSLTAAAGFTLIAQGCGVAGRIVLAAISDRPLWGRFFVVRVCMAAMLVGLCALVAFPELPVWATGLVLAWLGFFGFGWYGPWVTYVAEAFPPGRAGLGIGLAMAANQVAVVLAPPLLGLLKDGTGDFGASWIALMLLLVLALALTRGTRREQLSMYRD